MYPAEIFVRRKKYDTPVFQSRHPSLNEYIQGAVKAIGDELVYVRLRLFGVIIDPFHLNKCVLGQSRQGCNRDQGQAGSSAGKVYHFG